MIEEAGFTFGFWNGGNEGNTATMNIHCGSYSEWVGNSVVLKFPENLADLARWEVMARLFSAVANVWEPKTGRVGLTVVDAPIPNTEVTSRSYHWMLYYSKAERRSFPAIAEPCACRVRRSNRHDSRHARRAARRDKSRAFTENRTGCNGVEDRALTASVKNL